LGPDGCSPRPFLSDPRDLRAASNVASESRNNFIFRGGFISVVQPIKTADTPHCTISIATVGVLLSRGFIRNGGPLRLNPNRSWVHAGHLRIHAPPARCDSTHGHRLEEGCASPPVLRATCAVPAFPPTSIAILDPQKKNDLEPPMHADRFVPGHRLVCVHLRASAADFSAFRVFVIQKPD
jgi:hypothetical protein